MSVSVSMPQLGESVTEGTVTRWLKREGEHVQADEPLLEVSTDKVDTEIPSPVSGVLRGITVAEDETVAVGAELAVIDEEGSGDTTAPAAESTAPAADSAAPPADDAQASPTAAATDGSQGHDSSPYQEPYQAPAPPVPAPPAAPPRPEAPAAAAYQPPAAPAPPQAGPPPAAQEPPAYQPPAPPAPA